MAIDPVVFVAFGLSCCLVCLVLGFVGVVIMSGKDEGGDGGHGGNGPRHVLPFDKILEKGEKPWNTKSINNRERLSVSNGILTLRYAKNAHGGTSGAKISAVPKPFLPSDSIEFGYDVFFPPEFEWVRGGKLPGVCLSSNNGCSTGGDWKVNDGSARFMWRSKDGKSAYIIGYLYLPVGGNPNKAYALQGPKYKAATDEGNRTGHDVWSGQFPIQKGWNSVRMKIVLNTPKKPDGIFEMEVNKKIKRVDDVRWRDSSDVKISSINYVSFYGGSTVDWSSPHHSTFTQYKNFFII